MPRKKQVTFQQTIEGKFIPRKSSPTTSVYPLGATGGNRFNSKMVEFLTSSSSTNDDETTTMSQSKHLRQQIVTMLDSTTTKIGDDSSSTSIVATRSILKSQPITFGQLREKTSVDREENLTESKINEEQQIESTSTIEQINSVAPKSSTTVEEILAKFYIHSTSPMTNVQSNNENRAPPPTYASSIVNNYHRNPIGDASRLSSSQSLSNLSLSIANVSTRSPPPRYRTPSPPGSSLKLVNSTTFDHKFSRFLYGKDSNKYRRTRSKRKALSDPVKKEIDEANRFNDKSHRRFTTNLQDIDTDKEEQSDEVESSTRSHHQKSDLISSVRRRAPRSNNFFRRNLVPASPGLKRRIPTFLRVYSQASPSTDPLLQWDLFNIPELETLDMMMGRLYKNENLARVQSYEIYRTVLLNLLSSKRIGK